MLVVDIEFNPYFHYNESLKTVLSNPGHGNYECCIVDNWKCFRFFQTFHLSSKQILVVDLIAASGRVSHQEQHAGRWWYYLSPTYNAVLSFLPRQLNNHSHLSSPSPSKAHEDWLVQGPTSGPNNSDTQSPHVSFNDSARTLPHRV